MNRLSAWDYAGGLLLAAVFTAILLATHGEIGFVRDEGFYFPAAEFYQNWYDELWDNSAIGKPGYSFNRAAIDKHWSYNNEHPALMKTLFAWSWKLFHQKLGWLSNSGAMRLPAMAMGGLLLAVTYWFGALVFSRFAGWMAALFLAVNPQIFHMAHLACFDIPITALWTACIFAWWRSLTNKRWAWITGLLWGLALATKLNAFFIPGVMLLHWLFLEWRNFRPRWFNGPHVEIPALPRAWLWMAVLGPAIFIGTWPWLYHQTGVRIANYLGFHLRHEHYAVSYFHEVLTKPPFPESYPWVMTLFSNPEPVIAAAALAVAGRIIWMIAGGLRRGDGPDAIRLLAGGSRVQEESLRRERGLWALLLLNALIPIWIISRPNTPIFGGVKHWFPALPFLYLIAASELDRVRRWFEISFHGFAMRRLAPAAICILALGAGAAGILNTWTHGIAYYNQFIGGVRGAAEHGMLRNFWGYSSRQALEYLNQNVEKNGRVFFQQTNYEAFLWYSYDGLLRPREDWDPAWRKERRPKTDMVYMGGPGGTNWSLFHYYAEWYENLNDIMEEYHTRQPVHGYYIDEVPMLFVFRRPPLEAAP
ncbi:MAG: hypothetical protein GMKNLPBB_00489 [Myxococcota bacterium]|nr:hypothetical protein [Myxococcota bacterium]